MAETNDKDHDDTNSSLNDQNDACSSPNGDDKSSLTKQQLKEEKLAKALRDNLRRRKTN